MVAGLNHSSVDAATMVSCTAGSIATMVDYKSRLVDAMRGAGYADKDGSPDATRLAKDMGLSYQAVKKVIDGDTNSFSAVNNSAAARLLNVNSDWLATGLGAREPMVAANLFASEPWTDYQPVRASKFNFVPVLGAGAGGNLPERVWTDGDFPVGVTNEYAEVASTDPHAFIVRVVGTSMVPKYTPGDYALIEPGTDPDIEDDVLVRLANGQTMIKRLLSRRGHIRLGSYNETEVLSFDKEQVTWIYYVAYPVPARKIKSRV
jgi:phage repressor protein C with HTH and peptisase S24 domain